MADLTVIGFLPAPGLSLAEARLALDAAAENAGANSVRHWNGGAEASYSVFEDLDAPSVFGRAVAQVEIVGQADLIVEPIGDLPVAVNRDLDLSGSGDRAAVFICGFCGGSMPGGHLIPECPGGTAI
jgi:hypothetical protein